MLKKKMGEFNSEKVIAEFEKLTRDADSVQRETLRRILAENGATEYLQGLGLAGRTDPVSFRECVPLVTHADLEPYINRIADGDTTPILTAKPVTSISLSSGTTQGMRKYLLFNDELVKFTMQVYRTSYAFRNREFPVEDGKALQFIYGSQQFRTKGGLTAMTATTNVYRSEEFKATMRVLQSQCCSPDEVIFGSDFAQTLYCHLLCGLVSADKVQMVSATFAHSVVLAFQKFERAWEELCTDIRRGAPSPTHVTSPVVRQAVSALLSGPNPELADSVARKCAGLNNWYGVIPALWPNARYVYGIMTGTMEHYVKKLRHYAGGLPLVAAEYGASEGWIGVNVEPAVPPESATFTVIPDMAFYEFIPLSPDCMTAPRPDACYGESEPVGLTDVVVGTHYEVVMTTFAGLYRYRLGDVVQVAGFHNTTPKLKFVCRRSLMLSINIDKTSEQDVQLAVDAAAANLEVFDYTSHADMSSDPGHYVVFIELNADAADANAGALQGCCDELDRSLADPGYVGSRRSRAIGPLELRVLHRGTFDRLLRHYLSLGAPVSQFKPRRCQPASNTGVLEILAASTTRVFFSAAYD